MTMRRCILALLLLLLGGTVYAQPPTPGVPQVGSISGNNSVACQVLNTAGGTLQLTGTWTGTVAFEYSTDGVNWNGLSVTPQGGGTGVSSATSNGVWVFSNNGFSANGVRMRGTAWGSNTATTTCTTVANGSNSTATVTGTSTVTVVDSLGSNVADSTSHSLKVIGTQSGSALNVSPVDAGGNAIVPSVCNNDSLLSTAVINVSSNADSNGGTTIVALSGSKIVYVCGIHQVIGTAVTVLWQSGTGTNCTTTQSPLTGAESYAANGGTSVGFAGTTIMKTAAAANLCIKLGASQSVQGWVSYVQQ